MTARTPASRAGRAWQWARKWAPALVAGLAVSVFTWGLVAFSVDFPDSGIVPRIYASLAMFTGGYVPLDPSSTAPPTSIALPSMAAFSLTFATAVWVIVAVTSKRLRTAIKVRRANPQLVVVGSGDTATAIIQSAFTHGISTVLVAESEESHAARAAEGGAPVVTVPSVETCVDTPGVLKLLVKAQNVVIATDSAPVNLAIRDVVAPHRKPVDDAAAPDKAKAGELDDFRSLIAVVHDPVLAETMRPAILTELKEEDVTCPAENVAEHICHLIDAAATGSRAVDSSTITPLTEAVTVQVIPVAPGPTETHDWPHLPETIELWVRRLSWGRVFLNGDQRSDDTFNPVVPVALLPHDAPTSTRGVTIRIYAGGPQAVVAHVVEERAAHPHSLPDLTIIVADTSVAHAARSGLAGHPDEVCASNEWMSRKDPMSPPEGVTSQVVIVDPVAVGLDAHLVVDDVNLQWARMFAQTYEFMFAGNWAIKAWEPGAPLGDAVYAEEERAAEQALIDDGKDRRPADERVKRARAAARKEISNRYSNRYAVRHMLVQLKDDYQIVRLPRDHQRCPVSPHIPDHIVTAMAKAEHEDWQGSRPWKDTSQRPRTRKEALLRRQPPPQEPYQCSDFSSTCANSFTFEQLRNPTQEQLKDVHQIRKDRDSLYEKDDGELRRLLSTAASYNERIITETYPAIAARFGYAIVRANGSPFPQFDTTIESQWPLYHRRGQVIATQLDATAAWTTETGEHLTAQPGDWHVSDASGKQWCVGAEFFTIQDESNPTGMYEHVAGDVYRRVGTVRARPATVGELVETASGRVTTSADGWILTGEQGERWPVTGHHFARYYAACPAEPNAATS